MIKQYIISLLAVVGIATAQIETTSPNTATNTATGTGTTGVISKFTGTSTIGNSDLTDGTNVISTPDTVASTKGVRTNVLTPGSASNLTIGRTSGKTTILDTTIATLALRTNLIKAGGSSDLTIDDNVISTGTVSAPTIAATVALGPELETISGWTPTTDWAYTTVWTHTTGNTTALVSSVTPAATTTYRVSIIITATTYVEGITVTMGGITLGTLNGAGTYTWDVYTINTNKLTFTPTGTGLWVGTITAVSDKLLTTGGITGTSVTLTNNSIGALSTAYATANAGIGLLLTNTTPAKSGSQQDSPVLQLKGYGWTGSESRSCDWLIFNHIVEDNPPNSYLTFRYSANGATYSLPASIQNNGLISGSYLNSSNYVTAGTYISATSYLASSAATANTPVDGLKLISGTTATAVVPLHRSQRISMTSNVWDSTATAVSKTQSFTSEVISISGGTVLPAPSPATSRLSWSSDHNGNGYYNDIMSLYGDGRIAHMNFGTSNLATFGSPGTELITETNDREFGGAVVNWSGANWAATGGVFLHTTGATTAATLANAGMTAGQIVKGNSYSVTFTLANADAQTVTFRLGTAVSVAFSTAKTYTISFVALESDAAFTTTPTSTFTGSIDNISIKRITTKVTIAPSGIGYNPNATTAAGLSVADDNPITVTNTVMRMVGADADALLDTAPAINDGAFDGQIVYIFGTVDGNTVSIADNCNTQLAGGVTAVLGILDNICLMWDAGNSNWVEISRANN